MDLGLDITHIYSFPLIFVYFSTLYLYQVFVTKDATLHLYQLKLIPIVLLDHFPISSKSFLFSLLLLSTKQPLQ